MPHIYLLINKKLKLFIIFATINKNEKLVLKSQKYKVIYQMVWAFAILWISLGSLVNFHQHHLWRRQLIPQVVASINKKDKFKLAFQIKQNQDNGNSNGIDLSAVSHISSDSFLCFAPVITLIQAYRQSDELSPEPGGSPSLRAPPTC